VKQSLLGFVKVDDVVCRLVAIRNGHVQVHDNEVEHGVDPAHRFPDNLEGLKAVARSDHFELVLLEEQFEHFQLHLLVVGNQHFHTRAMRGRPSEML
jgi:hypothetical protein